MPTNALGNLRRVPGEVDMDRENRRGGLRRKTTGFDASKAARGIVDIEVRISKGVGIACREGRVSAKAESRRASRKNSGSSNLGGLAAVTDWAGLDAGVVTVVPWRAATCRERGSEAGCRGLSGNGAWKGMASVFARDGHSSDTVAAIPAKAGACNDIAASAEKAQLYLKTGRAL